jgi:hypothetical protein
MARKATQAEVKQLAQDLLADYGESARTMEFLSDLFDPMCGGGIFNGPNGEDIKVHPYDLEDAIEAL